jgi:carbon monoxide dehydrogenase subunit G
MKLSLIIFFSVISFTFSACAKISGDGPSTTQTYKLTGFTAVDNGLDADIYITQGSTYKVEIEAQQNVLDQIETPIVAGELRFRLHDDFYLGAHNPIIIRITMPTVTSLSISGSGKIEVQEQLKAGAVSLSISGSGNIKLASLHADAINSTISGSGTITVMGDPIASETSKISGSGNLKLLDIKADRATISISGSGNATIYATKSLDVNISGSGNVSYDGIQDVSSRITGSGTLRHL